MKHFRVMLLCSLPFLSTSVHAAETASAPDPSATWDLTLLYPDEAAWSAAKSRLSAGIPKVKEFEGKLGESAGSLLAAMNYLQGLRQDYIRLAVYASLKLDENTRDAASLERQQEIGLLGTEISRATSFVDPELLAVGEAKLRGFLDQEPGLKPYRFTLLETLRAAPHTLGAEAEAVLSATSLVTATPGALYGILANADMPWPTIKLSDGTEARLDQAGYTKWRAVANRADRQAVFEAFWKKFRDYERTFGVALFSQVKTDWFNASTRKYPSTLAAALDGNNIPEAVYRTLIAETNANLPTLHRYFKLRARMLGLSDLRYWDIYPPIVSLEKAFPLATGKELSIAAVAPLGPDYQKLYADSLSGRYTHYYPQPGKRSGAYMNGSVHDNHPYVLMNYNDDYE
ncbi:MAG TPA: M3 family metallopeptidase, partial [Opitutus sp.]|nr:M3 family metallopeptidase [Opitutus sp.]